MEQKNIDLPFLRLCLELARSAELAGEVPVGALVVNNHSGEIVARASNLRESLCSPIGHAEVIAIHRASRKLGRWRLSGHTLYSSLEPCVMCSGVILQARLDRVVFSALDPKGGGQSLFGLLEDDRLNHRVDWDWGQLEQENKAMLKAFFRLKRQKPKKT